MLKRTRLGLEVRAVAQNRAMAKAMGIRTEWVDALTFGLGSGIAGIAGVALEPADQCRAEPRADLHRRLVHGGGVRRRRQSLGHADRRQCRSGIVNKLLEPYAGAVLGKIFVLVVPDPLHPAPAAGPVPAEGPGGGG